MNYKYKYTVLNIYTGNYGTLKTNKYYEKGSIIDGELETKECLFTLGNEGYAVLYW